MRNMLRMTYRRSLLFTEYYRFENEEPPARIGDAVGVQPRFQAEVSEKLLPAPSLFKRHLWKEDTGTSFQFDVYTVNAHNDLLRRIDCPQRREDRYFDIDSTQLILR